MESLAAFAAKELGAVDIWVNNAGVSQSPKAPLAESDPGVLQSVVDTNLTGALFGSRAALQAMGRQPGGGRLFLMDGTGARGNPTAGNVAYGATKRALTQLKVALLLVCKLAYLAPSGWNFMHRPEEHVLQTGSCSA